MTPRPTTTIPPLTLEEQLQAAYALVDELHEMEVRLRAVMDSALGQIKGEPW